MKYGWLTAGVIGLVALAAGCISYFCFLRPTTTETDDDSLVWLRTEFKLSDKTFARVKAMHDSYEGVCAAHCEAIADSRRALERLRSAGASPSEIDAAMKQVEKVDAECKASTEKHVEEIAAAIGGREGERYLSIVLPRIATFDHSAPATLDLQQHHSAHDIPGRK